MISLIKMSCGPAFTKKLEGMLNDLSLAHEETKAYEKFKVQHTMEEEKLDFNVTTLTTSYWPTYKTF
jgi:Cullin family